MRLGVFYNGEANLYRISEREDAFYRGGQMHPGYELDDERADPALAEYIQSAMYEGAESAGRCESFCLGSGGDQRVVDLVWMVVPDSDEEREHLATHCGRRAVEDREEEEPHTPGPWEVREVWSNSYGWVPEVVVKGNPSQRITGYLLHNGEANARLIAASPRLLGACLRWLDILGSEEKPCKCETLYDMDNGEECLYCEMSGAVKMATVTDKQDGG